MDAKYELGRMPSGLIKHGVWVGIIHEVSADPGIGDKKDFVWVRISCLYII